MTDDAATLRAALETVVKWGNLWSDYDEPRKIVFDALGWRNLDTITDTIPCPKCGSKDTSALLQPGGVTYECWCECGHEWIEDIRVK